MTKKAKKVEESKEESITTKETVKRVSTENLIRSDKAEDKISGVARILADCFSARNKDVTKAGVTNKISKGTIALRGGEIDNDNLEKAKDLTNKSWKNIKECMTNEKTKLSKDSLELFELITSFGHKSKELPDEITF